MMIHVTNDFDGYSETSNSFGINPIRIEKGRIVGNFLFLLNQKFRKNNHLKIG